MKNIEEDEGGLPYHVPRPTDPDTAHDVLYPTSPLNERSDPSDDGPLLPPWVRSGDEDQTPLMDE